MKRSLFINFFVALLVFPVCAQKGNYRLLIGTYTDSGKSQGIYSYDIDMKTGVSTRKSVRTGVLNPSFLTITPDRKFVYSVSESPKGSAANAFAFNERTEKLTSINASLTKSDGPCFITSAEKHVFTANYGGGSLSVFGRRADGSLTNVLQVIQHVGKSINSERQNEPHVHQVILTPDKKYLLANDLGTDKVTVYQYNPTARANVLVPYDTLSVKPGSGPRHAVFSKDGKKLYLLQEIDGTVSVLGMKNGRLSLIQETSIIKNDKVVIRAADIHLSPDGKYLYATNRGTANDITCFSVGNDGKLTFIQQIPTGGDGPRNFAITPDGQYVFVAHQQTDNIVIFKRDTKTGRLAATGTQIEVGSPVCLLFY
ncbi:MAG: lactonase family protein [Bacteroidota bacterium]|nr:lactonase family protein [Bacteroidota bacterium]